MTAHESGDADADAPSDHLGARVAGWPVRLRGVTESVVATLGPNDRWNVAALGLHAPGEDAAGGDGAGADGHDPTPETDAVTAVTWGNTRTRRNFEREGGGVVQFTSDPRDFVDAALSVTERDEPVLQSADAWVRVAAERVARGESGGTRWRRYRLRPVEHGVRRERVPTTNRAYYAVVDATVAASRLDVPAYDTATLLDRLDYFAEVVEACGGPTDRAAFERIDDHVGWRDRRE